MKDNQRSQHLSFFLSEKPTPVNLTERVKRHVARRGEAYVLEFLPWDNNRTEETMDVTVGEQ